MYIPYSELNLLELWEKCLLYSVLHFEVRNLIMFEAWDSNTYDYVNYQRENCVTLAIRQLALEREKPVLIFWKVLIPGYKNNTRHKFPNNWPRIVQDFVENYSRQNTLCKDWSIRHLFFDEFSKNDWTLCRLSEN